MKTKSLRIKFLSGLLWLGIATAAAQHISGKVTDPQQQPVDGATVILQTVDSTFVDAVITEPDGSFLLNHQPDAYRLIVQHLLYETLQHTGKGPDARTLVLQPKEYALGEVVVKGERPLVKVEGSKLSYDMPQLTANKLVNTAYDCLKQLPGVIERDGNLTLAGAGAVNLIINGKPSSMTNEQLVSILQNTPAANVEKAEVMYSTPPQYHVRGASINVVLKGYKEGNGSWQGEVHGTYVQQDKASANGGFTVAYTTPKFNIDLSYSANKGRADSDLEFITEHTIDSKVYHVEELTKNEVTGFRNLLRLNTDYKIKENSELSFTYTTNFKTDGDAWSTTTGNISNGNNYQGTKDQMHNLALSYAAPFGLKIGTDYTFFKLNGNQDFEDTDKEGNHTAFLTDELQRIDRWKVYADQSHTLSHNWALNYGASFAYVSNRNRQLYNLESMESQNTDSRIDEYTYNAYIGFNKSFNPQWSLSASAAVEYYQMEDYKKWAVYPTVQLSYIPSGSHIFQLAFNTNKAYPDYWTLSGGTSYLSGYNELQGNPYLSPYTNYSASLNYILKSKYIFNISYDYDKDYFTQMIYMSPNRLKAVYNTVNWNYSRQLSLTAVLPYKIQSCCNGTLTLQGGLNHHKADAYFDAPFDKKQWTGIAVWQNTFNLSQHPKIQLEFSVLGQTKAIQGSYEIDPLWSMDSSLRWTSDNGKASLLLKGTDIFDTLNPKTKIRNGLQHLDMNVKNYRQSISLTFTYRFGGYQKKEVKEVDTSRFKH
ncbi:outer membrane beta-barrel family protein [uncultured Bacteroides sp.]|uniref:outer membrane beta-barrel family protein n=1 Tax=uncultured Bacteroides sp. TaxID=162156 RepID=UPI00262AD9F3|nr:outer membrane beta-barrel family protein [uncultured Bacteroides sp.]